MVEVREYKPHSFTQNQEYLSSMQIVESIRQNSSGQAIKKLAKKENMHYDNDKIEFAKEILKIMLDEISDGK